MGALIFSAFVSLFLAHKANLVYDIRKVRFAKYFILTMLCIADWSAFFAGELGCIHAKYKFFSTCLSYPGNAFISTMWFLFAAEYCGVAVKFIRRYEKAFFIIPALTVIAIFTNPFHWLYYSGYFIVTSQAFPIIIYDHGPLFWVIFPYFVIGTLLGILFFIRKFVNSGAPIAQVGIVIGALLPLVGTLLYIGDVGPFAFIDPSPFLFTISGLIIFHFYLKNDFLNLVPIARDNVIDNMEDGYIVTDERGIIADINPVVLKMTDKTRSQILGKPIEKIFDEFPEFFSRYNIKQIFLKEFASKDVTSKNVTSKKFFSKSLSINFGGETHFFMVSFSLLFRKENLRGTLVVLHDITEAYRFGEALKQANQKLNLMNNVTRHDILNQVNVIGGYTELLSEVLPEDFNTDPQVQRALKNLKNGVEIINDEITFTRDYQNLGVETPVWQSISGVAKEAAFPFSDLKVKFSIKDKNIEVLADPLLKKVFYILFENVLACGGKISEVFVSFQEEGNKAIIEIGDDGIGISKDTKKGIFEKSQGENPCFELALVRDILSITYLEIQETGIKGKGVRFKITLPPENWREIKHG